MRPGVPSALMIFWIAGLKRILALRHIARKDVIKGAVLSDEDDDVFDGAAGVFLFLSLERADKRTAKAKLKHGHGQENDPKTVQEF